MFLRGNDQQILRSPASNLETISTEPSRLLKPLRLFANQRT